MENLHSSCAGLDVHKETVVACARIAEGGRVSQDVRTFNTDTHSLMEMADWLTDLKITHLAMESTGVYWKPIWNLLEGVFHLILVNAEHIKSVPGRKTDVKDSQWIAQLLAHGLLRASFVPEKPVRQLRDLTRQRKQLVRQKAQVANRIHKTLEDANVKLTSVLTDVLGASGRDMLRAIVKGERDPATLAGLARGRLRGKLPQLEAAFYAEIETHHRFLLGMLLEEVEFFEKLIERMSARIIEVLPPPFVEAAGRLATIPGVDSRAAENIIAELGHDLSAFATAPQLASWAGLCPGNHQSGGKRYSGRTTKGNAWLKVTLVQCAWAASKTKNSYLHTMFWRLASRRGHKRALIAVAHRLLDIIFAVLKNGQVYRELGADYLDQSKEREKTKNKLLKRLEKLGMKVTVEDTQASASAST